MKKLIVTTALLLMTIVYAANSSASILSFTGDIEITPEPLDLSLGAFESSTYIRVFDEKQNYLLLQDLDVDHLVSGGGTFDNSSDLSPGTISKKIQVHSHLVHFDPPGTGRTYLAGTITFSEIILAVMVGDSFLDNSDYLGLTGTTFYNGNDRGLELTGQDLFIISENLNTLTVDLDTSNKLDNIRIITAVPIPGAVWLLGSGVLGLVGLKKTIRRKCGKWGRATLTA